MGRPDGFGGRGQGRGRGRGRGKLGPRGGGILKKHAGGGGGSSSGGNTSSSSNKHRSLKNQIRGVERLLKKEGLDSRVRATKEAELAELREKMAKHQQQELERKYAVKYHKIKFFERVKLERAIKKLERRLRGIGEADGKSRGSEEEVEEEEEEEVEGHPLDLEAVKAKLAALKDDLLYVKHFPKGEKYVSILRDVEDPEAQKHLEAERERLRSIVRRQVAEVAAVTEADEGRALLGDKSLAVTAAGHTDGNLKAKTKAKATDVGTTKAGESKPPHKPQQPKRQHQARLTTTVAASRDEDDEYGDEELQEVVSEQEVTEDDFFLSEDDADGGGGSGVLEEEGERGAPGVCRVKAVSGGAAVQGAAKRVPDPASAAAMASPPAAKRARVEGAVSQKEAVKPRRPDGRSQTEQQAAIKRPRHAFAAKPGGNEDGDEDEEVDDFFLSADDDAVAAGERCAGNGVRRASKPRANWGPVGSLEKGRDTKSGGSEEGGDGRDEDEDEDDDEYEEDGGEDGHGGESGDLDDDDDDGDEEEEDGPPRRQRQQQLRTSKAERGGGGFRRPYEGHESRHHGGGREGRGRGGRSGSRGSGAGGFRGRGRGQVEAAGGRGHGGRFRSPDQGYGGRGGGRGGGAAAVEQGSGGFGVYRGRGRDGGRGGRGGVGGRQGGREVVGRGGTPAPDMKQPLRTRAEGGRKRRKKGGSGA
ncbi:hypothetical protein Vafri_13636 [Volvox africanus]|uniref:rRNA-processing protein EFG1 n=2 Tax=Volvox africanus TaxID=51714 RepID=A0A8J4F5R0_9CHLO|nr:hypothetical protein Vafri_13636 [Volvox africanus]